MENTRNTHTESYIAVNPREILNERNSSIYGKDYRVGSSLCAGAVGASIGIVACVLYSLKKRRKNKNDR